jgi:putative FmdB family regulatory protein
MSTYEYKCEDDHIYTEIRLITEDQKQKTCPTCNKILKRIFTDNPILFKGSGFNSKSG